MTKEVFKHLGRAVADCDPNDIEIEPGFTVGHLQSRAECERAKFKLENDVDIIATQITRSEEDARDGKPWDSAWRTRAQGAIRWKRRAIRAVNLRAHELPFSSRPDAVRDRRKAILDVIEEELGRDEVERLVGLARQRHPELWAEAESGHG